MTETITWSQKARKVRNHHFDPTIRNALRFRDDDIFISTWTESGTTWTHEMVAAGRQRLSNTPNDEQAALLMTRLRGLV